MVQDVRRYKEDPQVRAMRSHTWFYAVEMASGLTSRELECKFSAGAGGQVKRSCIWNKYRAGTVAPRTGKSAKGGCNLVERVEKCYPGTARWLTLPVWRLIDPAPLEMSDIKKVYEGLPTSLKSLFVAPSARTKGLFWRKPTSHTKVLNTLQENRGADALCAALAMMREGVVIQDQLLHWYGATAAQNVLVLLNEGEGGTPFPIYPMFEYLRDHWSNPGFFGEGARFPSLWLGR